MNLRQRRDGSGVAQGCLAIRWLNYFSEYLNYFKKKNKVKIDFSIIDKLGLQEYIIDFKSKSDKTIEKIEKFENLQKISDKKVDQNLKLTKEKKIKFKRKKFKKKKDFKK